MSALAVSAPREVPVLPASPKTLSDLYEFESHIKQFIQMFRHDPEDREFLQQKAEEFLEFKDNFPDATCEEAAESRHDWEDAIIPIVGRALMLRIARADIKDYIDSLVDAAVWITEWETDDTDDEDSDEESEEEDPQ